MTNDGWKPEIDLSKDQVRIFIGKRLLAGITHYNFEGEAVHQEQFHGIIDRINVKEGMVVKLNNSAQERTLPPDVSRLKLAPPGEYRLQSTGEVVEDPDYTVMWLLYPPGYKG